MMTFDIITQIIFYIFSAILLFSAVMVVSTRHPVRSVLFLVLSFFCGAILWMLLQAEFLALVLIFVYVGAVMTLFLFVVMMLNLDSAPRRRHWVRYLPLGALLVGLLVALMWRVIHQGEFPQNLYQGHLQPADYSNTQQLGMVLYTDYVYPFELAAVLLLIAIVAAIALAFRGRRMRKAQTISQQLTIRREDRVQLIHIPSEKK
jgi:NADH-quinone oxidoreductase subunit J